MTKKHSRSGGAMGGFAYALMSFAADIVIMALILLVFAYFHHVIQHEEVPIGIKSDRYAVGARAATAPGAPSQATESEATPPVTGLPGIAPAQTASPSETPPPEASPTEASPSEIPPSDTRAAEPAPVGDFSALYPGMFTDGEIIESESDGVKYYKSANVNLTLTRYQKNKLVYFVADFFIRDIEYLKSALSNDKYGLGQREYPGAMARRNNALIAINGDQYSSRYDGYVIRNGMLYRDTIFRDICVLYWDGTMSTYSKLELTAQEAIEDGAYQVWSFGPRLLDEEGKPLAKFVTDVPDENPRTAIGYFAPGHYCFVVVEGRSDDSKGIKIPDLAALMSELGCMAAYNLDGGQTSAIVYKGELINRIKGGVRECSDIIMLVE